MIITDSLAFHVNNLNNFAANGTLNPGNFATVAVNQTTPNITLTLAPKGANESALLVVLNSGTALFNIGAVPINFGTLNLFFWNGTIWKGLLTDTNAATVLLSEVTTDGTASSIGVVSGVSATFAARPGKRYLLSWDCTGSLVSAGTAGDNGFELLVDGVAVSKSTLYMNFIDYHYSIHSAAIVAGLSAGSHTVTFRRATAGVKTDVNDRFNLTLIEI